MDKFSPKDLLKALWSNKPLFITVVVGIVAVIYILYKQNTSTGTSSTDTSTSAQPSTGGGTFVEESYSVYAPVSTSTSSAPSTPVASTGNGTSTGGSATTGTTGGTKTSGGSKKSNPPVSAATHTVTVTAWPSQTSTLFGVAQKVYGNGALWPRIYNANKSKIGSNPNLVHAGTVLTIPAK